MQIRSRCAEDQVRWIWTEGLQSSGQQEIAVSVPWTEHDPREMLLTQFLHFLERYVNTQPKRLLSGRTLRYGWTLLRFVRDTQNLSGVGSDTLLVEEIQSFPPQHNPSYGPGVAHTIALLQLQHEALRRNRITGEAVYPHGSQRALVCTRVATETLPFLRPLQADRAWQPNVRESGWFISCCDREHNHDDPAELAPIHLYHLVEHFPGLFPYLAMPVGTTLIFEETQVIVFRPGEQEGQVDAEGLLSSLP